DQKKLVFLINAGEGSNKVADVGANAKLPHPPDIDGDLHREDLITTEIQSHPSNYARSSACARDRRSAYSGKASASSSTCCRTVVETAVSFGCSSASAIQRPIWRISASFMPRVVKAGVPMRMPLGFSGGLVSKGIAFLFTVIPASPRAFSASLPS